MCSPKEFDAPETPLQTESKTLIHAPERAVFSILARDQQYPRWMPSVIAISADRQRAARALDLLMHADPFPWPHPPAADAGAPEIACGHMHECDIELEGRTGTWIEQCTELAPGRSLSWQVVSDNLGLSAALADLAFCFEIRPAGPDSCLVTLKTCYRPRHLLASLHNLLVLRPLFFRRGRRTLAALKRRAEEAPAGQEATRRNWRGQRPDCELAAS